jgi:hypothetical protein
MIQNYSFEFELYWQKINIFKKNLHYFYILKVYSGEFLTSHILNNSNKTAKLSSNWNKMLSY